MAPLTHFDATRGVSPELRRNAKGDVFCDMFSRKKYLLELYRDLHLEDRTTTEDDLELVTMERVVTSGPYNDLEFVAKGRLVVLVEAQSTWSPNIATRLLLYLAETYREIAGDKPGALYGTRLVELPAPELYVVYTGTRRVPGALSFRRDVLRDEGAEFDFAVHVITGGEGITGQYVRFARAYDEARPRREPPRRLRLCALSRTSARDDLDGPRLLEIDFWKSEKSNSSYPVSHL